MTQISQGWVRTKHLRYLRHLRLHVMQKRSEESRACTEREPSAIKHERGLKARATTIYVICENLPFHVTQSEAKSLARALSKKHPQSSTNAG
jgi:hypothetical protein